MEHGFCTTVLKCLASEVRKNIYDKSRGSLEQFKG